MEIRLYKEYFHVDGHVNFGIVCDYKEGYETYLRWVWFHMGKELVNTVVNVPGYPAVYPFKIKKLVYAYKHCNNAERQGKMIAKRIIKIIQNESLH